MVKCGLWRAGSRRSSMPKAEATGLAPKQSAERHDPLASPSEGFVLVRSRSPPCPAPSWQPVLASVSPSPHPLRLTLRVSTAFPFIQLAVAGVFVRTIALVKSRS